MTMAKIKYTKKLMEKKPITQKKIIIILFRIQDCLPRGIISICDLYRKYNIKQPNLIWPYNYIYIYYTVCMYIVYIGYWL